MNLAFKVKDLDETALASHGTPTKICSGCDPDVPGHQDKCSCTQCRGTGREPLSFMATLLELNSSRLEESQGGPGCGSKERRQSVEDDPDLFLEY